MGKERLFRLSAKKLAELLSKREISNLDIVNDVVERTKEVEPIVKSYITTNIHGAIASAKKIDKLIYKSISKGNKVEPLMGIPIAIKDNISTKGMHTTCGSKILAGYKPIYNATVIKNLKNSKIVIMGKTNMDEFAMGSSTENSSFWSTHNPWNLSNVPGGSSGGSAAAVAVGEVILALGSDTGGSIRQPAALCGVVGLKPTYGLVSRYGLIAFASSLDQIGPITRNVEDCALLLNVIAGYDPLDSTSVLKEKEDYTEYLKHNINGLKIGLIKELMSKGISNSVKDSVYKAMDLFSSLGAFCEEVSLPSLKFGLSAYYIIAPAEASSNLARYDGIRYGLRAKRVKSFRSMYRKTRSIGFGDEVKRRIMLGTYALSRGYYEAYYLQAQKIRTLIINDYKRVFRNFDVLISPTTPTVAFKIGEKSEDPLTMYLSDVCTIPVNLAGIPAISIPCGVDNGLPIGLQIMAPHFKEGLLIKTAYNFEKNFIFRLKPLYKKYKE
jgi:aspartyl-tRNA(Asn)/glutamyl-tRNA(Gln) amidotransferase subunit A